MKNISMEILIVKNNTNKHRGIASVCKWGVKNYE